MAGHLPADVNDETVDYNRSAFVGFVTDTASEDILRLGLKEFLGSNADVRRGGIKDATAALAKIPTPRVVLVDVSGCEHPIAALMEFSEVVEPDVRVLVIGENREIPFYRQLVYSLGVAEYLFKPLTPELVARFLAVAFSRSASRQGGSPGRLVTVTGAGGGVGASTVALTLAHHLATVARRHTLIFDPDLHFGAMATLLGVQVSSGLKMILEAPQRVDDLVIARSVQSVTDRLSLLCGEEPLSTRSGYMEGAITKILGSIGKRYNVIISDASLNLGDVGYDILSSAQQRIIVLEPTLLSLRNARNLLQLPRGPLQAWRPLVVLNKHEAPGALTLKQVEDTLEASPDVVIPYLPKDVSRGANLGEIDTLGGVKYQKAIARLAQQIDPRREAAAAETSKVAGLVEWVRKLTGRGKS